jgi:DNA-binding response OmpR family regulator
MTPTVLVVEDDAMLADVLQMALELEGCRVLTAERGEAALALVAQERPDFITLDLRLPDMDGHYLLEALHPEGCPNSIPVVILSGGHYRACASDGVVAVLPKPFAIAELQQVVRTLLTPSAAMSDFCSEVAA